MRRVTAGASALALGAHGSDSATARRPNLIVLLSDDQRFNTIASLGNPEIHTPNLDRLVLEGTAFTQAHIMGAQCGAVCIPSRAMLLTGRSLFHLQEEGGRIPAAHRMLPELMRSEGYTTHGVGKWHNDRAAYARAFSGGGCIFFGGMGEHANLPLHHHDPAGRYAEAAAYPGRGFSSELFADESVRFLQSRHGAQPFLLYTAFTAPHDPRTPPRDCLAQYPPEKIQLPPNVMPVHPFDNGEMTVRDELLAPWPRTPEVVREHIAAYYAMITHLDAQIGRILDALDATGLADSTVVVFAGDNGLALGQHGLMGKQNVYEHSLRVPLLVRGPGIRAGVRSDALVYLFDLFPSLCDYFGFPKPDSVEGKSFSGVLTGQQQETRSSIFAAYNDVQRTLESEGWKLIAYHVRGRLGLQLFHLESDPWETQNLAGQSQHRERLQNMARMLQQSMRDHDDPQARADWFRHLPATASGRSNTP